MDEATTPTPEEKEATPSGKEEAITSDKPKQENQIPPDDKKVAELEGQVEDLEKQVKQAQNLQRQADRKARVEAIEKKKLEDKLEKIRSGEVSMEDEVPEGETSTEREIRLQARVKIQGLIIDNPEYQEVLKGDITLKEILKNNPFAIIGDYLDSEDAVEQIREKLDERVSSLKKVQPKEEKKEEESPEFEAGPTQPKEEEGSPAPSPTPTPQTQDEKLEKSIGDKIHFT